MPFLRRLARLGIALPLLGLAVNACGGGDATAPLTTGSLQVTTVTSGVEPDPDGYSIQIDGGAATAIGNAEARTFTDVAAGDHAVLLGGLAANCTVTDANPQPVTVVAGGTASVTFTITCGPTTGDLSITAATTGSSPDADGYIISIDGVDGGVLGANATVAVSGVTAGVHAVGLTGVAANCQIQGENIQSVTVVAGAEATVAYSITCAAPPAGAGSLRISIASSGAGTDPNGYTFAIDGGTATPIGRSASTTLQSLAPGAHQVRLAGLSSNCSVQGANPKPVTVTGGATAEVSFAVTCVATTGSIKVTTVTTGASPDPNGYSLTLDANPPQPIGSNATVTLPNVPTGDHRVSLTGIATNCTVAEANPRTVRVTAGAEASVSFTLTCTETGGIQWTLLPFPADFAGSGLWASSASDLFVAGFSTQSRTVLHHNGQNWSRQPLPPGEEDAVAVWGSSPSDVYAAGSTVIWRYNGAQWVIAHDGGSQAVYTALGGISGVDAFAAGFQEAATGSEGVIDHWDGSTWSRPATPPIQGDGVVYDVWGTETGDAWAVGRQDAPDAPPGQQDVTHRILHYDGGSWTENFDFVAFSNEALDLTGVWGIARNDVYVVGESGQIWHFNGSTWTQVASPTTAHLRDVWGSSGTDVFAVGDAGILQYNGTSWSVIDPTKGTRVWGAGTTDVFVLVQGGVLHGTR